MSKRSRRARSLHSPTRTLTALPGLTLRRPVTSYLPNFSKPLTLYEDRRRFHPSGVKAPAYALPRSSSRLVVVDYPGRPGRQTKATVSFKKPRDVTICVRREERKQVLHAKGVAGGRVRPPRRSEYSDVSCK